MRITHLLLPVSDPAAASRFYRDTLQLPVEEGQVHIGWSRITLQQAEGPAPGGVHLAFNVPDDRFAAAIDWLRARVALQSNDRGETHFKLESSWESQSIYFAGPDDAILELIGRRRLPSSARTGPFHGSEMTCLSEVGLCTEDVPAMHHSVAVQYGLTPLSPASDVFAPMGDDEGLLILVRNDRRWFPEQRQLPDVRGLRVQVQDVRGDGGDVGDAQQDWAVTAGALR